MHHICRKALLFACFCILSFAARTQTGTLQPADMKALKIMEDSLNVTADSMYGAFLPDTRVAFSERFARQLVKALKVHNSWIYDFPKISKRINILYPDDKAFRIFNW